MKDVAEIICHPFVNQEEVARLMFPGNADPLTLLKEKIRTHTLTKEEEDLFMKIFSSFLDECMMPWLFKDGFPTTE